MDKGSVELENVVVSVGIEVGTATGLKLVSDVIEIGNGVVLTAVTGEVVGGTVVEATVVVGGGGALLDHH